MAPGDPRVRRRLPTTQPELFTERCWLRRFSSADADALVEIADDPEVARFLLHLPHPYPREFAVEWLAAVADEWVSGGSPTWAIERRAGRALMGTVWLRWAPRHDRAELGFWLGRRFWGHGYAREAAAAALDFGFDVLRTERVYAQHLDGNQRSAGVLTGLGLRFEGIRRRHIKRAGVHRDLHGYGLLRDERAPRAAP
ncbi:MAG: GNAT family N-acetyltransferase [Kofleriaceae bacterium]